MKRKIMITFLVISLLPLTAFGIFSLYETNKKINEMTECNLLAISENQVSSIQSFAKDRKAEMEMIAHYDLTTDAIKEVLYNNTTKKSEYLDNLLRERKKYKTYVSSISILDKNFKVVASSERYSLKEDSAFKSIDKKFHSGEFIMGNVYERMTDGGKKKLVPAYIGVYEKEQLIGFIAEELNTLYFDELRLNMDSLADSTFYLLDGKGNIITAGDTKQTESIGSFVTTSSEREDFQKKWDSIDHQANPTGKITYKYNNEDYITYYANVDNTNWSIRVTENLSAQKENGKAFIFYVSMILFILLAVSLFVQKFFTDMLLKPFKEAMDTFNKIQKTQDYSLRISTKEDDEFGELVGGINELLDYIEEGKRNDKAVQRKLRYEAQTDLLTGLKNKQTIETTVMDMLSLAKASHKQLTLGFLDVDNFKDFNTQFGHQVGDDTLRFISKSLRTSLEGEIGRMGGDEFIFCYLGEKSIEEIHKDMEGLLNKFHQGFINGQTPIQVTSSIGIVSCNNFDTDYTEMIRLADKAMYQAKEMGRNTFVIKEI